MGRRGLALFALVLATAVSAGIFLGMVGASGKCGDDPLNCGGFVGDLRVFMLLLTVVLFFGTLGYAIFVVVESVRGRGNESPPSRNRTP